MEDSSNGKLEDTQKIDQRDADEEVVQTLEERKLVVNDSGSENKESEPEEKSSQVVDFENPERGQEVSESVVDTVDAVLSLSEEVDGVLAAGDNSVGLNVIGYGSEENEKGLPTPNESESDGFLPIETNDGFKETEEQTTLSSPYENDGQVVTHVISWAIEETKGIEELTLLDADESNEIPQAVTDLNSDVTDETKLQDLDEKIGEPSGTAGKGLKEKVDELVLVASEDVSVIDISNGSGNKTIIPESRENPLVISAARRTSWLGCCGLFEALRRFGR